MRSILTEYQYECAICGRPAECEHHLVFGNGLRPLADKDGLKIPMCNNCHNMGGGKNQLHETPIAERLSKIAGQLAFENERIIEGCDPQSARDEFRRRYSGSYL